MTACAGGSTDTLVDGRVLALIRGSVVDHQSLPVPDVNIQARMYRSGCQVGEALVFAGGPTSAEGSYGVERTLPLTAPFTACVMLIAFPPEGLGLAHDSVTDLEIEFTASSADTTVVDFRLGTGY